jgi:hypothetical protein
MGVNPETGESLTREEEVAALGNDVETLYEFDNGPACVLLLRGHIEDDLFTEAIEYHEGDDLQNISHYPVKRGYCKKVPREDGWSECVLKTQPMRGAFKVTWLDL